MANEGDSPREDWQHRWRPIPWNPIDVGIVTFIIFAILLGLLGLVQLVGIDEPENLPTVNPFIAFLQEAFLILLVWLFAIKRYHINWRAFGLRLTSSALSLRLPGLALLIMISATVVYSLMVRASGIDILTPPSLEERGVILGEGLRQIANIGVIVLWGPFAEEILFRGFILAGLISWLGEVRAAVISAALFAAAHIEISSMIPIFILGIILAWLYLRTRSLWPPIIAHSLWNILVVFITLLIESGQIPAT